MPWNTLAHTGNHRGAHPATTRSREPAERHTVPPTSLDTAIATGGRPARDPSSRGSQANGGGQNLLEITKSAGLGPEGGPLARASATRKPPRKQQRKDNYRTSREPVGNPPYSARLSTMRACPVQRPCAPLRSRRLTYYTESSTGRWPPAIMSKHTESQGVSPRQERGRFRKARHEAREEGKRGGGKIAAARRLMLGGAGARREGGQGGRSASPGQLIEGQAVAPGRFQGAPCTLFEGQTHPRQGFRVQVASTWALLAVQVAGGGGAGRGRVQGSSRAGPRRAFQRSRSSAAGRGDHRPLAARASPSRETTTL